MPDPAGNHGRHRGINGPNLLPGLILILALSALFLASGTPAWVRGAGAGARSGAAVAAGDVARCPHPLFGYQFLSLEHWGNAVERAEIAAHNMICARTERRPHLWLSTSRTRSSPRAPPSG